VRTRALIAALGSAGALLLLAAPGSASTQIKIREVAPGNNPYTANPEFVELQAFAEGQAFVNGRVIRFYGPSGNVIDSYTIPANVANGGDQRTILLGSNDAAAGFGVTPDFTYGGANLDSAGGAVCYAALDCVAWGSFAGTLPSSAGAAAAAVPDGQSLKRTIARGCATSLDPADDTNSSSADFALTNPPTPRRNAAAPDEVLCGSTDTTAPDTEFLLKPKKVVRAKKGRSNARVRFKFRANEQGSTFECAFDGVEYSICSSPVRTGIGKGRHKFSVRAIDEAGNIDLTPAVARFRVKLRKKHKHGGDKAAAAQGSA